MPKCTINGKTLEVPEGTKIIEAFHLAGEKIAHYCWHPALSVAGVCRLCMVSIEGNPRPQIACNTQILEGMVCSNQSEAVREAVKWTLDFHLINHPLDCPICDQAGECSLQNQYMQFGLYSPEMAVAKVKKRKVVDLGPRVVLDSERCILCARCVRFTNEVTKTFELGIFERGDRSEVGTFKDRPLNNNYSLNTVDICPVGALTSKQFRFRQRAWLLKENKTICPGCCVGCNVTISYNSQGVFRARPRFNKDINGYWMCDEGRDLCVSVDRSQRLKMASHRRDNSTVAMNSREALQQSVAALKALPKESLALVLTGQYTCEEYDALIGSFQQTFQSNRIYYWVNNPKNFDQFDGILLRGDRNPNTVGLLQKLEAEKLNRPWTELEQDLFSGVIKGLIVAGPEFHTLYSDMEERIFEFNHAKVVVWLSPFPVAKEALFTQAAWVLPTKSYLEKEGHFINYRGFKQKLSPIDLGIPNLLTAQDLAAELKGESLVSVAKASELATAQWVPPRLLREADREVIPNEGLSLNSNRGNTHGY